MDRNNPDEMNDEPINNGNVHPISAPLTVMVPPLSVIVPPLPPPSMINADIIARNRANMVNQYLQMSDGNYDMDSIPPPKADFSAPPPYDVAANSKLPTYEEVQREKHMQGETQPRLGVQQPPPLTTFLAIETVEAPPEYETDSGLLGTDFMFCTAFFVAFLFNWIGFLLLMCFCHTIASRYGALSGFGLSLAKWTLIVKHSTELASHDNSWLCWLIMAFGILICIRAIIQYLHIKRGWRLLSGTAQERLLFFH